MIKLLDVKKLKIVFSSQRKQSHAVNEVDFSLYEGETLGIVGESGCGKSATARSIIRLLPPHIANISGEILYKDQNLLRLSEKKLEKVRGKEISMIFQDPMTSLNPTLKIGTQIKEGYRRHHPDVTDDQAHQYTLEMLELVGISEPEKRIREYPHTLSGGMRQRVMIAIALACMPKILIADEPTTALDVTIQAQILSLLKELKEKTGTSIILITHDLSVIAGFCDRVIVMYAGQIVETASVEKLFYSPQHPYTKRLLESLPKISKSPDEPLIPIEGSPPTLSKPLSNCAFCPRCPAAMNICTQMQPPLFPIQDNQYSKCWLHDPRLSRGKK